MRHLISFLMLSLLVVSCKKDGNETNGNIIGKWELEHVSSYFGSQDFPQGNGTTLEFIGPSRFEEKRYNNLLNSGNYNISQIKDCSTNEVKTALLLHYDQGGTSVYFLEISGNMFLDQSPCYVSDGANLIYHRL